MSKPKKLIEVAMPVKEISAESLRDKTIRKGHVSTLHKWWARRPLPVCRAVVFASLVPDPLDDNCPQQFKEAIELLLGKNNDLQGDPYKPYEDIPHTAVVDKMEDNLRNRLMLFIGKFSDKYVQNEKSGKETPPKEKLNNFSLIDGDIKNDEISIGRARKLIFVSHNAESGKTTSELLAEYEQLNNNIKKAEAELYSYPNRHIETEEVKKLEKAKDDAIAAFLAKMPKVFDPFAGGGAIPLEAARLGCNSYGNDINPVAHIIQKGSCEFPQKYGKPITYGKDEFIKFYGENEFYKQQEKGNVFGDRVNIPNRLAFDVEFYAKKLLENVEAEIGHYFPKDKEGKRPVAYHWARIAKCENPTCNAKVPLLKHFYLSTKPGKKVHLIPRIKGNEILFEIGHGEISLTGWNNRGNLKCPCCNQITDVNAIKKQSRERKLEKQIIAVMINSKYGKNYRLPREDELNIINDIPQSIESIRPTEKMQRNSAGGDTFSWGISEWGQLFSKRQLLVIQTFVDKLNYFNENLFDLEKHYEKAVSTYLSIWISRICTYYTEFGVFNTKQEIFAPIFGRQAIPIVFDFPEGNPFTTITGMSVINQLDLILDVIKNNNLTFSANVQNVSSGELEQFNDSFFDVTITDPPYYDAIAYADLSDFFYIWMKRTLGKSYPFNFAFPQTPKNEECTALKHHHNNDLDSANNHFVSKLSLIFKAIEKQTTDLVSIMFAHQSTKAWTTLCNSILQSNMNINGSWAFDSEVNYAMKANQAFLSSSVTVACKPSIKTGIGDYKEVQRDIYKVIKTEVKELYALGFRGADLLTACFGKAVSVFGKYESVEKADGSVVTVAELLEMAREAAFDAIISDIETDDLTKFYIGWLNLFGFSEAVHDDVRRISQIGLSVDISDIYHQNILVKNGDKGMLGSMSARISADKNLGLRPQKNYDIDIAQRMMFLFDPKNGTRSALLKYISEKAPTSESSIWRVLNSLAELLPKSKEIKDRELATGLLSNQENLLREAKNIENASDEQIKIEF